MIFHENRLLADDSQEIQGWEQSAILNQENMSIDSKMEKKLVFLNHFLKA